MLTFWVPGRPVGKERPRYSRRSRSFYTPHQTHAYERLVAMRYLSARDRGQMHGSPPWIGIIVYHSTDVHADCDNIFKAVADAIASARNESDKKYTGAFVLQPSKQDGVAVTVI